MKYVVDSVRRDGTITLVEAWSQNEYMPFRIDGVRVENHGPSWLGKTVVLQMVEVDGKSKT